ncbi:sodium:proton antiporter [Demequina sp. NBRC 110053]|uniref:cation:proton antiporter n=1 Tax=Demequina sp. NBRC 110053 TaxID=1570342 RepID=UPI00135669A0|nr:sodium:proton antiporter [Demequina sp. NBRC 110053]
MTVATSLVVILAAGLAAQVLAAKLRIPAIVVLIAVGLVLGPFTGIVDVPSESEDVSAIIGLGVAVVLFEGAMDLRLREIERVGKGIRRLTLLGPPIAMILGASAAHWVGGFEWPVAWVLGALLVVTGPTVIIPLLRQARLGKESAALLKWEGIINDPIGVLLAYLTLVYVMIQDADVEADLQFITEAVGLAAVVVMLLGAIVVSVVLGGGVGYGVGVLLRRGLIPAHLRSPLLLVLVLVVFSLADQVVSESGLLAVTLMGLVLGNMRLADRERLLDFKESISVVVLSGLFIVIPAQLELEQLASIDWRTFAFIAALMFVVRPLTVALVTIRSPIRWQDRVLLGWIAPRGIVAAATAGVFGPELVAAGYEDGDAFLPTVFLVIICTVLAHGFSIGWLARRLGLASGESNGLLIVGASPWTQSLADALRSLKVAVTVADGSYQRLQPLRMQGVPTYFGEVLSEHAERELDPSTLSYALCATDNDYYNALVARSWGAELGYHRTFMIATHGESAHEERRLPFERRASFAFDGRWDYVELNDRASQGWSIHTTRLTSDFGWTQWQERQRARGVEWMLVGEVGALGSFRLYSDEQRFTPEAGATVLYFSPSQSKRERALERESSAPSAPSEPGVPDSTPAG